MRIRYAIEISRDPERVFYWLGDPGRALQWMTSVKGGIVTHQTEHMVGTTFEETVRDEKGSTTLRGVVSKWIPNQLIAFELDGEYNSVQVEFKLEPENGKTRVTQTADIRFKSVTRLIMFFLGPLFKKKIARQLESEFGKLKELCESEPAAGGGTPP